MRLNRCCAYYFLYSHSWNFFIEIEYNLINNKGQSTQQSYFQINHTSSVYYYLMINDRLFRKQRQENIFLYELSQNNQQFLIRIFNTQTKITFSLALSQTLLESMKIFKNWIISPQDAFQKLIDLFQFTELNLQGGLVIDRSRGSSKKMMAYLQLKQEDNVPSPVSQKSGGFVSITKVEISKQYQNDYKMFKEELGKICVNFGKNQKLANKFKNKSELAKTHNILVTLGNSLLKNYRKTTVIINETQENKYVPMRAQNRLLQQKNELLTNILNKSVEKIRNLPAGLQKFDVQCKPITDLQVQMDNEVIPLEVLLKKIPKQHYQQRISSLQKRKKHVGQVLSHIKNMKQNKLYELNLWLKTTKKVNVFKTDKKQRTQRFRVEEDTF